MSSFLDLEAQVTVAQAEIKEVIQILELLGERGEGAFHHASVARFCLESLQDKLADFKEDYLDSANALKNAELKVQGMTQDLVTKQQAHQLLEDDLSKKTDKIARLTNELDSERLAHEQEIQKEKVASDRKLNDEKRKREELSLQLASLQREHSSLCRRFDSTQGKGDNKRYPGKRPGTSFFINEFEKELPMSLGSAAGVRQLDGANWHFQVTKNDGISIAVVPTIWLTPVLPYCQEFQDDWNPKIAEALCEKMLEKSKVTHPANFKRVAAAKQRPITNNEIFTSQESAALKKSKTISLFDAASLTRSAFFSKISKSNKKLEQEVLECMFEKVRTLEANFIQEWSQKGSSDTPA